MDGCSRQNPAYRLATENPRVRGGFLLDRAPRSIRMAAAGDARSMQDFRAAVTSMATKGTWNHAIGTEADFWRSWFTEDRYAEARDVKLRSATSTFPKEFAPSVGLGPGDVL